MMAKVKVAVFTMISALSLLLCVATVALWVRSYWADDIVTLCASQRDAEIRAGVVANSVWGCIAVWGFVKPDSQPPGWWKSVGFSYDRTAYDTVTPTSRLPMLGFGRRVVGTDMAGLGQIALPHWVFVLSTALLPLLCLRWHRERRRRARRGLCPTCGYDLRASKERCPECGTAIAAEQAAEVGMEKKDV